MIQDKLIPVNLEQEMKKSFIAYAMAVIVDRALPDVRDGLKPVHRRILYDMSEELGMTPDKPTRKSARVVGDVLGKFHPHGDSSVYDAMVRLAQPFNIRYPLIEGQGNFGSVDGDGAAAMRYTEARLQKLTMHLLDGIDKDTVDFYPNFDETLQQPSVLPARFPNLLVNGSSGIAVGMATNIPPHNLTEVINGVICMIDNPECTIDDLMQHIKGPDFPTGGLIMGRSGIRAAYHTGHGRITVRAKTNVEEMGGNRSRIIVTEIPYQVNKSVLVKKIADLVHEKKIEGISDIRDESNDRQGMRIVIELKRDVQPQVVLNMLYKHTPMQENFGANMLALVDGKPQVLNLREMIYYYLEHQKDVVTRRTRFELNKAQNRAHILEGLLKALDHIDEIVAIIRASKDTNTAKEALMLRFEFSEKQAQAILDMRLARLTGLERERLQEEYEELERTIERLTAILGDEHLLMDVIKTEISEIRDKFGDERRSELTIAEDDIDIEDLIQEENMVVTLTHEGYVKRVSSSVYRAQHRGGRGVSGMNVKETDYTTQMFVVSTHQEIMFFTNMGRVYSLKCYQIPEAGRQARGTAIINLLHIVSGEKVSTMLPMPKETEEEHNLVMATRNGMIKKTALEEFRNLRKNGLIAIALREGDELIGVRLSNGDDEMLVSTRKGKCIRFNERHVRNVGRNSIGVRSMRVAEGDEVIDIAAVEPETTVLAITTKGYGKRTDPEEYREQGRGGMGVKAMQLTDKTGDLAALMFVHEDEDILLITDDGTIIRARAADVRLCGRSTQGVRIMRLAEGSTVVGVCRAEKEEEEIPEEIPAEGAEATEAAETSEGAEKPETEGTSGDAQEKNPQE
ncbi:DNA gyrase subunit A [Aristaeella lactis]|uniref:DNA gyrase subunit A n=1 Tax=Aristaeella lactis TaxID=3046383 RepID=A0AC61PN58_9FIRM|nr:DNA gyrase subunit A [Aristaeella lactis]QUA52825.1 DNA gyrase subunit A [Aristaeella lactis]SMC74020.1 DNA gyrase subunit A [Aristaeella lactis]